MRRRLAVHLQRADGERVFDFRTFPFEEGVTVFFTDITDLTRRTEDLSRTASLLGATLESTADGILAADGTGLVALVNRRFLELWRVPHEIAHSRDEERVLTHMVTQLRDPETFLHRVRELYSTPDAETFDELELLDGRVFERYSVPQSIEGVTVGRVWSFRDVTQRKAAEQQLVHDAFHDALTFLPNRSRFTELLSRSISRARIAEGYSFAMLFLDLDRFKVVNDSLGHTVGDELLVAAARRLERCVRPGDTVARLGGDEFTVLIDNTSATSDATRVAERIMAELQRPFYPARSGCVRERQHRHRAVQHRLRASGRPAPRRGPRDVPGQGEWQVALRGIRPGDARAGRGAAPARDRPAARDRARGVPHPLPAGHLAELGSHRGRRSTRALGASAARPRLARRVPRGGRRDGTRRRDGELGAPRRPVSRSPLGSASCPRPPTCR